MVATTVGEPPTSLDAEARWMPLLIMVPSGTDPTLMRIEWTAEVPSITWTMTSRSGRRIRATLGFDPARSTAHMEAD